MPFYEYECSNCKFYVEVLQKISDAPLKKCPSCGKSALKKLVSAPVFRLKGGGWYETDFKSDQEGKRNLAGSDDAPPADEGKKDKATSAPSDAKTEKKADAKPVAKPAGKPAAKARPAARAKARPKAAKPAKKKARR
ncbi:MAG TPA: zinc ribbon domain-containing protein [Povalibacter sp.]|jgi:putative FmdB family regulatory protein|nr:zinc ribbon domain-containing protein [Povalibacter sp.]